MIKDAFKQDFVGIGFEVTSASEETDGTITAEVASTSPRVQICPSCGGSLLVTTVHAAQFRDVPYNGHPVLLSWRRRYFRCGVCLRPSHETHPDLEEKRRVTRRLGDWIWREAGAASFTDIAQRCGMSQKTVIALFRKARDRDAVTRSRLPSDLGLAMVSIAGLARPVICNSASGDVVDVYRSTAQLVEELSRMSEPAATEHRLTLDLALHGIETTIAQDRKLLRLFVPPASVARVAAALMVQAASAALAAQAKREGKSARTRLVLFSRSGIDLGRIGWSRIAQWRADKENGAHVLARAYDLKEDFLELCRSWWGLKWQEWKRDAADLPAKIGPDSRRIDYGEVITLIDRYADAIDRYQQCAKGSFDKYEETLRRLAGLKYSPKQRFPGVRAAILREFGRVAAPIR